jgi:hypothetical protein
MASKSTARVIAEGNRKIKAKKEIERAAGESLGGIQADTEALKAAERDLNKINTKTGMTAAEQADRDSRGTKFDLPKTIEEVATGIHSQQFKGHGGKIFNTAEDRNKHNAKFIRELMSAGAPIPPSMHKDLETTQRAFDTTKNPATKEEARKKIGRIMQAGSIDLSKFPNGTACQTPGCENNADNKTGDVVCAGCVNGTSAATKGVKGTTKGTKMKTKDVAGAAYKDQPAPKPKDLTKTKAVKALRAPKAAA